MYQLIITLPMHKSETVGFFHSGGKTDIKGWWAYSDGEEGGELHIDAKTGEVDDFDGAMDLPKYIKDELRCLGLKITW